MDPGNHSSVSSSSLPHRTATIPAAPFPPLPRNLFGHGSGEPGHDHTDGSQFSPAYPHVLFPWQFVFIDLCQSTVITPKMLVNFVTEENVVSYPEWLTQLYFFLLFIIAESYLLAEMAYGCYVAICSPLLYNAFMSYRCFQLTAAVYVLWITQSTFHTCLILRLFLQGQCG